MVKAEMVEKFVCPGCVCGYDTKCGHYKPGEYGQACTSHVLGTFILPVPGHIALGMPKGFNRPEWCQYENKTHNRMRIRVWEKDTAPEWGKFNVPVWALEKDGVLFVRTLSPRISMLYVDIIDGGSRLALCPEAIDVGPFHKDMD